MKKHKLFFSSTFSKTSEILKRLNIIKSSVSNINSLIFNEWGLLNTDEEEGLVM